MALEETVSQKKSREKLVNKIQEIQKTAYAAILDYVEVAIGNREKFKPVRSKILRASNDAIRKLSRELEKSYAIEYISTNEDLIVVTTNKKQ